MPDNYNQDIKRPAEMESWEVIVKYSGDISRVETGLGVEAEVLGGGFAIITLRADQIPMLYDYREIEYFELPKPLVLTLSESLRAACISPVQSPSAYHLTGAGTLVGIIDSGIDYTHPDFRNQDGSSRILYLWDQTVDGIPPDGFRQGAEYNNQQLNAALAAAQPYEIVNSIDPIGHGTAVAGIAAGNGRASEGREKGAAPEASLIIVKLGYRGFESFARTTEVMRALKYILDKAEELGMPVAVNISFGANAGSHDGSSLFETYVNAAAGRWKNVIAAATGNEGAAGHHFSGEIGPLQTVDVGFVVAERLDSLYLTFWKNFADNFTLELILPSGNSTGEIVPAQRYTVKNMDGVSVQIDYGQPTHYNENQEIYILIRKQESSIPKGFWQLRVSGREVIDGRFDIWLPTLEETGIGTVFTAPSPDTTLTLPATVKNVISVGGYNAAIDAAAPFSGRGFTRNNVYLKPDLVAPAVGIITTQAGGGYDSFTGTSMAAPFVAGAAALLMQWGIVMGNDPFLYGQRVKAYLQKGARRKNNINYPNPIWGYGALCLKNTMDLLAAE